VETTVADNGEIRVRTDGEDPWILFSTIENPPPESSEHMLAFEYFCPDGINGLEIFYGPPITAGRSIAAGNLTKAESWMPAAIDLRGLSGGNWSNAFSLMRLDFGRRTGVEIGVRHLKLRAPTLAERRSTAERERIREGKKAAATRITTYLEEDHPRSSIEKISVTADSILFEGVSADAADTMFVVEAESWRSTDSIQIDDLNSFPAGRDANGNVTVTVPRFSDGRDRLTSRWALATRRSNTLKRITTFRYVDDFTAISRNELRRMIPQSQKGMGGVWANEILDELVELGVHGVTLNLQIGSLIQIEPRKGWETFEYGGSVWHVNPHALDGVDRLTVFAENHGIVVSAIVLVPFGGSTFQRLLVHPEANRAGHYAMPNLTSREGALVYEAAIALVAERYARIENSRGRISNWIVHNEVDYGWEWTNMGRQPTAVFLETYVRSMRIIDTITRSFNPHSRTFISLTHNWNVDADPGWKTYSPRTLLEDLAKWSQAEGDFPWGLAYHPYPQSLFKADAWNDTIPTDDFDTRMITPKNLAVLDRWMRRPDMRYRGDLRGILLSEQGYHTPDYSPESQALQSRAFVYTWEKMLPLKSIETFHNHRWIDHPREGGLKLGIRTLPTAGHPYGEKKAAWETYRNLGRSGADATD
jgi:hypothetical protein